MNNETLKFMTEFTEKACNVLEELKRLNKENNDLKALVEDYKVKLMNLNEEVEWYRDLLDYLGYIDTSEEDMDFEIEDSIEDNSEGWEDNLEDDLDVWEDIWGDLEEDYDSYEDEEDDIVEEFGDGYEDENFDFIEEKTDDIKEEFIVLDDEDLYDF